MSEIEMGEKKKVGAAGMFVSHVHEKEKSDSSSVKSPTKNGRGVLHISSNKTFEFRLNIQTRS